MTGSVAPQRGLIQTIRDAQYQLPHDVDLRTIRIPDEVIELVPESAAREGTLIPIHLDEETLTCATPFDTDVGLQDKLRFILNRNVRFVWADFVDVVTAINRHYGLVTGESADSMLREFTDTAIDFTETEFDSVEKLTRNKTTAAEVPDELHDFVCDSDSLVFQMEPDEWESFMFYTVPDGQRAIEHRRDGSIHILQGPCRVWNWFKKFERMKHHIAHPGQYLSIRYRDGRQETRLGPTDIWQDPREHDSIKVHEGLDLAAKEAVVVYGGMDADAPPIEEDQSASRRIFYGPGMFVPRPGEWLHRFSWHASHGGSRGVEKRPGGLQFEKLCLMPDQMYHDVRDVRTSDDAVLTIRLMIFFELVDIDRMLDTTRDPIGDFINAATSDVVEFTGKRSFEQFKQQTEQLNDIDTYAQLLHRAQQCGYKINNVVYRGYGAPDSLQAMHDEAIQTRTRLQLERATEEQAQDVEDYKLKCQMDRSNRRRTEQLTEVQHDLELKRQQSEADLKRRESEEAFKRDQCRAQEELELEIRQRNDEQLQAHLESLRNMQVDLTEFLTQARADQVIEVRGRATMKPELHLANGKKPK